ncbi:AIR synthase-related protein [Paraliomyxa miuraensis]|uniref:AIR synthase-related protein n=1 Tax=Paraliomyxa miuraensis TaxID=376150 RepID=UPI00225A0141|nr:AIR synthase-related protein [Paraliomyxa miuraensis]MCX4243277.1 AIR synthase-related protein [Paraliomyxa miuraensis]
MAIHRLEIEVRPGLVDALAEQTRRRLEAWLGLRPAGIRTRRVIHLDLGLSDHEAQRVLAALVDPVAEVGAVGMLPDEAPTPDAPPVVLQVGLRPGVTDSVGTSVRRAAEDCVGRALTGRAHASTLYLVWGLTEAQVQEAADAVLHNPLVEHARILAVPRALDLQVPRPGDDGATAVAVVPLRDDDDDALTRRSIEGMLALSLAEMRAIQQHFRERGRDPTDAELECLAQTWSEHCKHKIFAAPIEHTYATGATEVIEEGLFRRYIRGATEAVAARRRDEGIDAQDAPYLVSVFHDNAGVVRCTEVDHLVYKVETHNSPSALDPYGGAMTGIVGVNRDSFGTGRGADLLANVWGYCFGDPHHAGRVPRGLMHPRRIRDGVHHGVIDGGNQSGIPYMRGWELFDARYLGKPLVFCGTVAVMPVESAGRPTHEKYPRPGDRVVMVGGRIGKDGIHGATFSSVRLDERSPVQAVQIGDPITQKMMFDMLTEARDRGLMSAMTDNGAGGLSSSVGEMAESTGGARIDLALAPLKYPGLAPWEILISEAQERMTVVVPPDRLDAFLALAERREVEATVLGELTDSGRFVVTHGEQAVVDLSLRFLHEGWPRALLRARLDPPARPPVDEAAIAAAREPARQGEHLLALLQTPELACGEARARGYDHEVKGLGVIKPFVGVRHDVPASATVMRIRHGRPEGVVLGEGVHPFYADADDHGAFAMAQAAVDEGVRRVLCAGARWDRMAALDNFCWPDPIVSERTPDGEHKLAQLVECCRGLAQACEAYGLPLISGKDSMKNDAVLDGVKISIPPTLLVSVMGQMQDVSRALTLEPRAAGDVLVMLGDTREELGGSAVTRCLGLRGLGDAPRSDPDRYAQRYRAFVAARDAGLVRSAAPIGRGGLGIALAHALLAAELDVEVELPTTNLDPFAMLWSESTGRLLLSARVDDLPALREHLGSHGLVTLGRLAAPTAPRGARLRVRWGGAALLDVGVDELRTRFRSGLPD